MKYCLFQKWNSGTERVREQFLSTKYLIQIKTEDTNKRPFKKSLFVQKYKKVRFTIKIVGNNYIYTQNSSYFSTKPNFVPLNEIVHNI